jgi:hypothetical protein
VFFTLRRAFAAMTLCCAVPVGAHAAPADNQAEWDFFGSVRLRYENVQGQVRPDFNAEDDVISVRTILAAERTQGPLRLMAEMYDSRVYGADRQSPISTSEVNTLELVQAFAELSLDDDRLGDVKLQAGRFMLNLGSRRLVAADDYRNTTSGYTGLRADFAPGGIKTTLIYVMPQVRRPDDIDALLDNKQYPDRESTDLVVWGGLAAKPKIMGAATLEGVYFHLEERDTPGRPTRDRSLDTFGGRLFREPAAGKWDYEVELYGQTGTVSSGTAPNSAKLDVRAGFFHADAGYTAPSAWSPRLSAEIDYASGDDDGERYGRFDTLFGMRRADFGPSGIYAAIGRTNIITPAVRLEVEPSERLDAFVAYRAMWLASKSDSFSTTGVRDAAGRSGSFAGHQLEGRVRYWAVPDLIRLEANALWLAKGEFLTDAPNAPATGDSSTYIALSTVISF